MANIIFTNECNLSCPFCFASENNKISEKSKNIFDIQKSWEVSSFLSSYDFKFCGGEPTLNVEIIYVLKNLLKSGFECFFMTNGLWPDNFSDYIKKSNLNI